MMADIDWTSNFGFQFLIVKIQTPKIVDKSRDNINIEFVVFHFIVKE